MTRAVLARFHTKPTVALTNFKFERTKLVRSFDLQQESFARTVCLFSQELKKPLRVAFLSEDGRVPEEGVDLGAIDVMVAGPMCYSSFSYAKRFCMSFFAVNECRS
jgi:hypothetical protein